jgi:hypothetical protein
VIIKKNLATECCITNGAPATVWGWKSSPISPDRDEHILDTLFVELDHPPRDIHIEGLPKNVVPIYKDRLSVDCQMPNDSTITISRQQIPILPNFAMTVHASQGRTRKNNVCDLSNCQNHMAVYTALSRSSSADGTVILQGFDANKIQGGLSGYLRQEFRELEILDEITRLKFEDALSSDIIGNTRSQLISNYYSNKLPDYLPYNLPEQLAWSKEKPMIFPKENDTSKWMLLSKKTANKSKNLDNIKDNYASYGSNNLITQIKHEIKESQLLVKTLIDQSNNAHDKLSVSQSNKRMFEHNDTDNIIKQDQDKKVKLSEIHITIQNSSLTWLNNSCAYDSIIFPLYHIWCENPEQWQYIFTSQYKEMYILSILFQRIKNNTATIGRARTLWRDKLHKKSPHLFSKNGMACIYTLQETIFKLNQTYCYKLAQCTNCDTFLHEEHITSSWYGSYIYPWQLYLNECILSNKATSIQDFITFSMNIANVAPNSCCENEYTINLNIMNIPQIFSMVIPTPDNLTITSHIEELHKLNFNRHISIKDNNSNSYKLHLKAIVYIGEQHFNVYIIDKDDSIWFHDGMRNQGKTIHVGYYDISVSRTLYRSQDKHACTVIYAVNK